MIIVWIVGIYLVFVFVVLRLVAPFAGIKMYGLPENIPADIKNTIATLENVSTNQRDYLERVYAFILEKNKKQWNHTRFQAATRLPRLFVKNLEEIWVTQDFLYCTAINYAVFVLLAGSKYFTPADIRRRHTFVNFVWHQYLQVKINNQWVDIDPAGSGIRGRPLGTHLAWFG